MALAIANRPEKRVLAAMVAWTINAILARADGAQAQRRRGSQTYIGMMQCVHHSAQYTAQHCTEQHRCETAGVV